MKSTANLTIITLDEPQITDFSKARNQALAKVKTDWVLFVDKDEIITSDLELEIKQILKKPKYDAYKLHRLDTFLGKQLHYGENGQNKFVRLARHDWGKWIRPVHEVWQGSGRVGELKNPLLHTPHPNMTSFLSKINFYSSLEAKYRYQQGKHSSLLKIACFPPLKFFYNYIYRQGFRDGVPGTIMAIMMSFHSFLTWTKLYLLWQKN